MTDLITSSKVPLGHLLLVIRSAKFLSFYSKARREVYGQSSFTVLCFSRMHFSSLRIFLLKFLFRVKYNNQRFIFSASLCFCLMVSFCVVCNDLFKGSEVLQSRVLIELSFDGWGELYWVFFSMCMRQMGTWSAWWHFRDIFVCFWCKIMLWT